MISQHHHDALPITVATVYGYPQGPTWPKALSQTDAILTTLTREVVLGARGFRVICGDFNHDACRLHQCQLWQANGWVEAQALANAVWGTPPQPTCKNATQRDFIWLSPEAASYCVNVQVSEIFQEHSTLIAGFSLPCHAVVETTWPLPSELPWADIDVDAWHLLAGHQPVPQTPDSTQWFSSFSKAFEHSLDGHVGSFPGGRLPSNCFGRGSRTAPQKSSCCRRPLRASRPGEDALRHDGLGAEVRRWFQQLRRLQSLVHATRAANPSPSAQEYRLALWHSICNARGFRGGFATWWLNRPIRSVGSPSFLPQCVPDALTACLLHEDFRSNFRKLESWHMRNRARILDAKYDKSLAQIYTELRDPAPEQVDTLQIRREYAILASDPSSAQLHLERPPDLRGTSTWTLDGSPVSFQSVDADVCSLAVDGVLEGSELEQVQTLSSVADLHREFVSLWAPRWQQHAGTTPSDWRRFLDFAAAYLPAFSFDLPDIDVSTWNRALRRFRPRAARGPDGWARDDLLHLPRARTLELLGFLHSLELQDRPWPKQLVTGFVCLLCKGNGRLDANGFRPLCLFSIVYRTWAGIRARQSLAALRQLVPEGLLGFVPGRTAAELWYSVQMEVELSILGGTSLLGYSTDIIKAFNSLPRIPLMSLASQLGCPRRLLRPWCSFLEVNERRFMIRQEVSCAVLSTSGFPEGCPLSPLAMVFADCAYHAYMREFAPSIRVLSYVDNYAGTAHSAAALLHAFNLVRCFIDMLRLQLDESKTFVWATNAADRSALASTGLTVSSGARELGGIMSFSSAVRNAPLRARFKALAPLWGKLRRSRAPVVLKLLALPAKFWARALHGIAGVPVSIAELHSLRTAAANAIGIRPGGSSSMLRLSLAEPSTADPGFYQLLQCVLDIRRMSHKVSNFLAAWRLFYKLRDGRPLHGPLNKLAEVLAQIGWAILEPPQVLDHDGLCHDLISLPEPSLRRMLQQAWLRFVAFQHQHRHSMADLRGIDLALLRACQRSLSALDLSRLSAIQSGAFWCGQQQARFDLCQNGLCARCGVEDSVEHRIRHCPRFAEARTGHEWVLDQWDSLPVSLTHHLLPSQNPFLPALRQQLLCIADTTGCFFSSGSGSGWQFLFTDGSCSEFGHGDFALAGWGLILANTGAAIACGQVPGLTQSAPRAEILAMTAAVRWALYTGHCCIVWTDADNVRNGVVHIQECGGIPGGADADLWCTLRDLLSQVDPRRFLVRHTPSHLDVKLTESPLEDWLAVHNDHADRLAGVANNNRSYAFREVHQQAVGYHDNLLRVLLALRAIFFGVAERTQVGALTSGPEDEETVHLPPPGLVVERPLDLEDTLPVNWVNIVSASNTGLPSSFVRELCSFLFHLDAESDAAYRLSWLELVFVLHCSGQYFYPVCNHEGRWVDSSEVAFPPAAHTVAARLSLIRRAMTLAAQTTRLVVVEELLLHLIGNMENSDMQSDKVMRLLQKLSAVSARLAAVASQGLKADAARKQHSERKFLKLSGTVALLQCALIDMELACETMRGVTATTRKATASRAVATDVHAEVDGGALRPAVLQVLLQHQLKRRKSAKQAVSDLLELVLSAQGPRPGALLKGFVHLESAHGTNPGLVALWDSLVLGSIHKNAPMDAVRILGRRGSLEMGKEALKKAGTVNLASSPSEGTDDSEESDEEDEDYDGSSDETSSEEEDEDEESEGRNDGAQEAEEEEEGKKGDEADDDFAQDVLENGHGLDYLLDYAVHLLVKIVQNVVNGDADAMDKAKRTFKHFIQENPGTPAAPLGL
ncbi:Pol [Symbiodinium sp. CCMP2592]|nr:Pol [Symbiodinium sp. CCMP2592]